MACTEYSVTTWDADEQKFTPQNGVPSEVQGVHELRRALRRLQGMGYIARKYDAFVRVEAGD